MKISIFAVAVTFLSTVMHARASDSAYIFLQKFPLENTWDSLFHTEVVACPKSQFSEEDRMFLDDAISNLSDYMKISDEWWKSKGDVTCTEFGYGGSDCSDRCCSVPHGESTMHYAMNARKAVIANADVRKKTMYLYGQSSLSAEEAYHYLCLSSQSCWSNWAGTDYNALNNNCNTFTSTVLHCVYGLSEKKPNLGPSDMVTVTCDKCPKDYLGEKVIMSNLRG